MSPNAHRSPLVYAPNGQSATLGESLGGGGEGEVFALVESPGIAVKRYHFDRPGLAGRRDELQQKVAAQITLATLADDAALTWPRVMVFDGQRRFIGYAMRRAGGVPLTRLAHPMLYRKHFPHLDRLLVVEAMLKLCRAIARLHAQGVILGDINLGNILLDPDGTLTLIDADSYQLSTGGRTFRCPVGKPELTAPEFHGQRFEAVDRTVHSDRFALAIVLFQCLMLGRHPYDLIGGGTPVENIRAGHFPYGTGGKAPGREGAIPRGPWYLIWDHLTYKMKDAFIKTFTEGTRRPEARIGVGEWIRVLDNYRYCLQQGYRTRELRPSAPKPKTIGFSASVE